MGKVCRVVLLPVYDGRVFESDTAAPGAFRPWCRSQGEVRRLEYFSGPRYGVRDSGERAFTSDPRAGRATLKVGAPPEGRLSRDTKGAHPDPRESGLSLPPSRRLFSFKTVVHKSCLFKIFFY